MNGQNIELIKSENSWLKLVLVFSQNEQESNDNVTTLTESSEKANTNTTTKSTTIAILSDFIKLGSNYYYFGNNTKLNWQNAFDFCKTKGAKLAYPKNAEEANNIGSYFNPATYWWIGGKRRSNGNWFWSHDNSTVQYIKWDSGFPYTADGWDCLGFYTYGNKMWNTPCYNESKFICQL
ncbi:hypothetical protein CHUAL_014024 [Chamberlinius hualienensis]